MLPEAHDGQLSNVLASVAKVGDVDSPADKENSAVLFDMPTRPRIMMVDDEKLNIYVVAEYLKSDGYRDLIYTDDPRQALPLAIRERPDAVLLDIQMPELNGLEILQKIRADNELVRTPVVILTSSKDDEVKLRAIELGATDFLNKPIHCGELLARLRNILMAKAYQDQRQHDSTRIQPEGRRTTQALEASHQDLATDWPVPPIGGTTARPIT